MKLHVGLALLLALSTGMARAQESYSPDPPADPPAPAPGLPAGMSPTAGVVPGPLLPLEAAFAAMNGDRVFVKLLEHDRMSEANLHEYSSLRTYSVVNEKGRTTAQQIVQMEYHAPDHKSFSVKSGSGSSLIRSLVLDRLVQSEKETASGRAHGESAMKPQNYELRLIGEQDVGPYRCLVAQAVPKRRDRYLFEGKVWISSDDFGIVRMAGHPAKPLSFWLTRAEFVRQYKKIGDFWLPAEDETLAQMRFYGKKTLVVTYGDYEVNGKAIPPAPVSKP